MEFFNSGKLDIKNFIIVMVWVKFDGLGKIFEYKLRGVIFGIWLLDILYVCFIC